MRFDAASGQLIDNQIVFSAYDVDLGPDGAMYVAGDAGIWRLDPSTGTPALWALVTTTAIAFAPTGSLYATWRDQLLRLDSATGTVVDVLVGPGSDIDEAIDVNVGPDGLVYVSDCGSRDVRRFDPQTGAFLGVFLTPRPDLPGCAGRLLWRDDRLVDAPALDAVGAGILALLLAGVGARLLRNQTS